MSAGRERGLATLEWIIVLAAALRTVIDDAAETPSSLEARVWEADTAAARIERDARQAQQANPARYDDSLFRGRCHSIGRLHADAVAGTRWVPGGTPPDQPRCEVTRR